MIRSVRRPALVLACVGGAVTGVHAEAFGQQTPAGGLSVERIFGSAEFRPRGLDVKWLGDGERYSTVEFEEEADATDLWVEGIRTGKRTRLVEGRTLVLPDSTRPLPIEDYEWSADESKLLIFTNAQRVWRLNTRGLYYVYDVATRKLTPVSRAPGWQMFAKFSPDGKKVGFVRDNNLFVADLASGTESQLTSDGGETVINGTTDWVYEEELDLRDAWRWSPDGRRIAYWRFDQSPVPTFYMIDELRPYSTPIPLRYPKAGTDNSRVEIRVVELATGRTSRVDVQVAQDGYLARMDWAASSDELVIQRLNRHQNRLDVLLADANTGRTRVLLTDTDSTWVDIDNDLTWLAGGRQFLWSSERDGNNHLYVYGRDGKLVRQVTRGDWEVTSLDGVDEKGGWVYFTATRPNPRERQVYRVKLNGTGLVQLSSGAGTHTADFSPNFGLWVDAHSTAARPAVYRLHSSDGKLVRVLEDNARVAASLSAAGVRAPEFFRFRTRDGAELDGWMIKPPDFDASRKYPVLMYVYGGPGSQTVLDAWGGDRFLWHQLLAQRGYIVASIDNRGTGARGRAFKKLTYLNLGKWESDDQIEGARYLASLPHVDGARIGIWGWSYGGYMTALSMARGGTAFRAGISVAPVTDWRLYDTIYTERFMRTPQENPNGYRDSAPLRHVAGLTGRMLVVHGTGDDNVHFQNTAQLTAALQQAGKQFGLMIYPNRTHSISGGATRVHLFTMMTDWLEKNL